MGFSYLPNRGSATPILSFPSKSVSHQPIRRLLLMRRPSIRALSWSFRLLSVVIAFWWPAILRDPIYTPRHARLSGQELQLPAQSTTDMLDDARALAIFWHWEHRTKVTTHWLLGPSRGLREAEGRKQTLIVLLIFWGLSSVLLARWTVHAPPLPDEPRRGIITLLSTPLWQWFSRR